jgi:branched-chain amino acid aminotransferase
MSPMQDLPYIWMNGELTPRAQAALPVNSAAVFYATNVFEGLRAYWNDAEEELYCFRLAEHFARLRESMKMMRFTVPYSDDELYEAVREVLMGNDVHDDIHMHLVAYVEGNGMDATEPTGLYINLLTVVYGVVSAPGPGPQTTPFRFASNAARIIKTAVWRCSRPRPMDMMHRSF